MERGLVHAPGCADALGATLVERAGFEAAYLSGFALSATSLGQPDLGLIGLADVADAVRRIVAVVDIPVIADIDTGFGGPLNVRRTVLEVEAAGAAGVQIEDQLSPKRCGHFDDKQIVDLDEAVARVEIAVGVTPVTGHRRDRADRRRCRRGIAGGDRTRATASSRLVPTSSSSRRSRMRPNSRRSAPRFRRHRCCTTPSRGVVHRCSTRQPSRRTASASSFTRSRCCSSRSALSGPRWRRCVRGVRPRPRRSRTARDVLDAAAAEVLQRRSRVDVAQVAADAERRSTLARRRSWPDAAAPAMAVASRPQPSPANVVEADGVIQGDDAGSGVGECDTTGGVQERHLDAALGTPQSVRPVHRAGDHHESEHGGPGRGRRQTDDEQDAGGDLEDSGHDRHLTTWPMSGWRRTRRPSGRARHPRARRTSGRRGQP